MVIRRSSARQVNALIAQLRDGSPVEREAAIARLRVIGARALDRLVTLARSDAPDVARAAALNAIEAIDDPRSREAALALMTDGSPAVAAAAITATRSWLPTDASVLDAVTALALDRTRQPAVRLAALDALAELPRLVIQPVLQQVGAEDAPLASRVKGDRRASPLDHPAGVRDWVAKRGPTAPLSAIHDMIARIRERERDEPSGRRRQEWQAARAAAHLALARRDSRVALYDMRETFDAATTPLPLDLLHAVAMIGDASCLEPMARAWEAAGKELWWRDRLAEAARAVVAREKLTARNAVVKRIRARHPDFLI
jgi:hypothetical protein